MCLIENRPETKLAFILRLGLVWKHPVFVAIADKVRVHRLGKLSIEALYLDFFEEFYNIRHSLGRLNSE